MMPLWEQTNALLYNTLLPGSTGPTLKDGRSLKDVIHSLEVEENSKEDEQLLTIDDYEEDIESFLDIRCSYFKRKELRLSIQETLISKLSTIKDIIKYKDLMTIFENDHKFCGYDKQSNGKLRQLYVKYWQLLVERNKYKNIVEKLKLLT